MKSNLAVIAFGVVGLLVVLLVVVAAQAPTGRALPTRGSVAMPGVGVLGTSAGPHSSIQAGFNSFSLTSGDVVWFSAVAQLTGTKPTADFGIRFTNQTLTFVEPNGTTFTKRLSGSAVQYVAGGTSASTSWGTAGPNWVTTVPLSYSGNVFLSGYSFFVPAGGLPGSTKVTWSGNFTANANGTTVNWKWSAAVYSSFAGSSNHPNYPSVGVKPVDDNHLSAYQNSDHAGTPENFVAFLVQGGTGGGGSNFTGSYSGTTGVRPPYMCF